MVVFTGHPRPHEALKGRMAGGGVEENLQAGASGRLARRPLALACARVAARVKPLATLCSEKGTGGDKSAVCPHDVQRRDSRVGPSSGGGRKRVVPGFIRQVGRLEGPRSLGVAAGGADVSPAAPRRRRPSRITATPARSISPRASTARRARAWSRTASRCRAAAASISSASPITSPAAPITRTRTSTTSAVGMASWYGDAFHGRKTANGEIYDKNALSAAHPTMPLPSYARVTNLQNGYSVIVRVNDRGPYAAGRVMDVLVARRRRARLQAHGHGACEGRICRPRAARRLRRQRIAGDAEDRRRARPQIGGAQTHGRRGGLAAGLAVRLQRRAAAAAAARLRRSRRGRAAEPPPPPAPPPPPRRDAEKVDIQVADAEETSVVLRVAAPLPPVRPYDLGGVREASVVAAAAAPQRRPTAPSTSPSPARRTTTRSPACCGAGRPARCWTTATIDCRRLPGLARCADEGRAGDSSAVERAPMRWPRMASSPSLAVARRAGADDVDLGQIRAARGLRHRRRRCSTRAATNRWRRPRRRSSWSPRSCSTS